MMNLTKIEALKEKICSNLGNCCTLPGMSIYARWDAEEQLIYLDLTGVELRAQTVDTVCEQMIRIARKHPDPKPFVLVNWSGGRFLEDGKARFDARIPDVYVHVRAIVRYGAEDIVTRVTLRTDTLKHRLQDLRSHIYDTRAQALQALREFQRGEQHE